MMLKISILVLGIFLSFIGWVPLSRRNNPVMSDAVAVAGFFSRLFGMLLLILILIVGLL